MEVVKTSIVDLISVARSANGRFGAQRASDAGIVLTAIETLVSFIAEIANPTIMTVVKSMIVYPAIRSWILVLSLSYTQPYDNDSTEIHYTAQLVTDDQD